MITSGIDRVIILLLISFLYWNESVAQRFNTNTSTDCGNININFAIKGGLEFCEGDTISLINATDSIFDYYIVDWSEGKLDTFYDKKTQYHVYYFPDSVLCEARPLAVYFLGIKNCKNNKQTSVWGAYGINHIYRPLAGFSFEFDSVCYGKQVCMRSSACNADSIVWNYDNELITTDSCYTFNTSGTKQITMIAFNKCASDTLTKSINVVEYPSAKVNISSNVKNNSVCKGDTVTFVNASNLWSSAKWILPTINDTIWLLDTAISNQEKSLPYDTIIYFDTLRIIVLDTGIIKLRMISINPCDSITWDYNLEVVESAIIQFNTPQRFCETADYTPDFNIIGAVDKYNWSFPGGNPASSLLSNPKNIRYNQPGTYTVILRATNSCGTSTDSLHITIDPKPTLTIDTVKNPVCKSAGLITLNANIPNGVWSGTGVDSNGIFDPTNLATGNYEIIYTTLSGGCLLLDTLTLVIVDTTSLNVLPLNLCINTSPTQLTANPPGGIFSGPGINAFGEFDPSLTGLGEFTVNYYYTDVNGCNSASTAQVNVEPPPQITHQDTLVVCIGITSLNLIQALAITSYPNGGQYSFILNGKPVNPIINASNYNEGIYQLLINYKINLCNIQDTAILVINQPPTLIISNDTILCDGDGIFRLQTNLKGGIWTGPAVNPTTGLIDLRAVGSDTAVYTYTFDAGNSCETSQQCTIIIDEKGKGIIAGQDVQFCRDNKTIYDLTGFSPGGGKWSGHGITNDSLGRIDLTSLISDSSYTYYYCFYKPLTSPCTFCDSVQLTIHSLPTADFDISGVACLNTNFTVVNKSAGANNFFWDFGDGTTSVLHSPAHVFTDTGKHILSLTVTNQNGCSAKSSKTIDVTKNPPLASFALDSANGCAPFFLSLKNNSSGDNISYAWHIADSIYRDSLPIILLDGLTKDSIFKIVLTVMNSCGMVSDSDYITVHPYPQVDFGIDSFSGCSPLTLNFANTSLGNVDQFIWDMGNGNRYFNQNPPKQIYTTNDSTVTTYQIKLIGMNECGKDSLIKAITVNPPDVSAFIEPSKTRICQYDSLLLKSFSTPGSNIDWKIINPSGLISTSNQVEALFTFDDPGNYTIILHAVNCGEDFDTVYIQVLPAPTVDFELPLRLCLNDTAIFRNKSIGIGNSIWDFGDGTTSNNTHAVHRFLQPGKYTVRLTGYSITNNCPATIAKEIIVLDAPEAKFQASVISGCAPLYVDFTNLSTGATKYNWSFSDQSSNSLEENPTHIFSQPGSYTVILQVLDTNECFSDTALVTITTYPTPKADFSFNKKNYCLGKDTISLVNNSTGASSYIWNIDSTLSNVTNPKYLPTDTGLINIQLITTNIYLCSDTVVKQVFIIPSPKSQFTTDRISGCEDLLIHLTNNSLFADHFIWDFGDTNTSTINSPKHLFKDPGSYTISLIGMGSNGCPSDTATQEIVVWALPDADFNIRKDSLCGVPMHVRFTNNSTSSANYNWTLDGNLISTNTSTEFTFDHIGDYHLSLKILNAYGCSDSVSKTISIYEQPIADFTLDNEACENTPIQLYNNSKHAIEYEWFIESMGHSNEFEPKLTFNSAGNYDIQLIAINNPFCKDTLLKKGFIKIYQQPLADFSFQLDVDKNIAGDVQFTNLSKYYTDQKWVFGDGLFTLYDNPLHVYAANQAILATLYVYNFNMGLYTCLDSITKSIDSLLITTFFAPNAFSPEYGEGDVRVFKPVGLGLDSYEISVYSPWGERVWFSNALENHSPSESWDGEYKGTIVPQGAYTWLAKISFINGNRKIAKGTVTVLR